ncbi:hydrolase TatD [Alicyclobacillus cellulosilyticus]|uniref:Hydrolase TatD n=1 Tax=Alicyclobacillus cellulosilyticus TaxID=1003997 RepID=A0A917KIY4_9BACL|nr:TatD family hydrolase [Alicyclobacillus cellulosilyticus]GGJ14279.1 hydrolase TatD [Alicyclobacillus cellulosilyticus]
MLIDTHCHLNDDRFRDDLDEVLRRAEAAGVAAVVVPGVDVASSERAIALAERYPQVFAAVGIHPEALDRVTERDFAAIAALADHPKVVAIGEVGLDYYWNVAPPEVQQEAFRRQMVLAREKRLPVIVHNRDATEDTVRLIEEMRHPDTFGVMHCFTENIEIARRCIAAGFYISYAGPVTFKNADRVRATAAQVPLVRMVVETDAPYLTPHPFRGRRNEPGHVRLVAERLADVRGLALADLAHTLTDNARRLFPRLTLP